MAYPIYIPTRSVSVGGAAVLESSDLLKIQVAITSSKSLVWNDTGFRFESSPKAAVSTLGSEVVITLPRTDVAGWRDASTGSLIDVSAPGSYSHQYTAQIRFLDTNDNVIGGQYTLGPFALPDGVGTFDLDTGVPAATVAGGVISIPDLWSQQIAEAQAAAAAAEAALIDSESFVAQKVTDEGPVKDALTATIVEGAGTISAGALDTLVGALDMRAMRALTIVAAGDSTTSPFSTGAFERAWQDCASDLWPERPFSLFRWSKDNSLYNAEIVWQDAAIITDPGGTDTGVTILSDSFSGENVEMNGRAPEVGGSTWGGSAGAYLANESEMIANPAYSGGGIPAMTASTLAARSGKVFELHAQMRISTTEPGSRQRRLRMNLAGTTELRIQVVGSTSASTCDIVKIIGGTSTSLGAFTGAIPSSTGPTWYDVDVTLVAGGLSDYTVTATLNGVTVTAGLTAAEVAGMGNQFGLADQSINGGLRGQDGGAFTVIGDVTRAPVAGGPSPYPKATVYNASVAGSTLDWQIEHMEDMFPAQPDVVFIHHGHNYFGEDLTDAEFVAKYVEFLDLLFAIWEPCPVVVSSQNPEFAPKTTDQIEEHQSHMLALRSAARSHGWGYVPIYEAFAAREDGGLSYVQPDGIHPIIGFGTNLQTATLTSYIEGFSRRSG